VGDEDWVGGRYRAGLGGLLVWGFVLLTAMFAAWGDLLRTGPR